MAKIGDGVPRIIDRQLIYGFKPGFYGVSEKIPAFA